MRFVFVTAHQAFWAGCLAIVTALQVIPAHAMDPNGCTVADLQRMGDQTTDAINEMIKLEEAMNAKDQRLADDMRRRWQLEEQKLSQTRKELDFYKNHSTADFVSPPWILKPHPLTSQAVAPPSSIIQALEEQIQTVTHSAENRRLSLQQIELTINARAERIRALREELNDTVNAFRDLISNPYNYSARSRYETACRLKSAANGDDVKDIMKPVPEAPPVWKRFLPDPSKGARYEQGADFDARARSRLGSCFNAIAAVGGAIISFWPSDSAKAAESEAPSVNYPIRRGPYMPGDGDRGGPGAPLCPPEPPLSCPPSPYVCPEEPQPPVVATATATATPAGGSSSSSASSSSSEGTVE